MNPVFILTHNCLEKTKRCVESVRRQDIPVEIWIQDNGSTDGTQLWIRGEEADDMFGSCLLPDNVGVSKGWNSGLRLSFEWDNADHVLVIGNDTVIPSWFYSRLLNFNEEFVSGCEVADETIVVPGNPTVHDHPDFAAFLIRKSAWQKIGPFDERFKNWCNDLDYHVRAHRAGVRLWGTNIPYYHERSSTIRNAPLRERRELELQADADRDELFNKWGVRAGSSEYASLFSPETFGIDVR